MPFQKILEIDAKIKKYKDAIKRNEKELKELNSFKETIKGFLVSKKYRECNKELKRLIADLPDQYKDAIKTLENLRALYIEEFKKTLPK